MKKISTGADSTLANWHALALLIFNKDSEAVKFLEKKVKESPNGWNEEVIADEGQLIMALIEMNKEENKGD